MTDQPRWPRGAPDDERGHGQGGRFAPVGTPGTGGWVAQVAGKLQRGWANDDQARAELATIAAGHPPLYEGDVPAGQDGVPIQVLTSGNEAEVWRVDLPDGRSVIIKSYDSGDFEEEEFEDWEYENEQQRAEHEALRGQPSSVDIARANAEVVAALIAGAIGAPVAPVVLDPKADSIVWMGLIDGDSRLSGHDWATHDVTSPAGRDAWLLGLLDLLIYNNDRHGYNYIVKADGRPVGIDHGEAGLFSEGGMWPPNDDRDMHAGGAFAGLYFDDNPLTGRQHPRLTPNPLHPDDIAETRRRLRQLHAQGRFDDGHLRYMEAVLDMLHPHARGIVRLIP